MKTVITIKQRAPASWPPFIRAAAVAFLLLSGCSTQRRPDIISGGASPLADDLRFRLGTVALVADARPAQFSFDKAKGQIGCPGDWAEAAAGNVLGTSTSEPIMDLPTAAAALVVAPLAAAKGAIDARKYLSPDKLGYCETSLINAMSDMSVQRRFHTCLLRAAGEQCPGRLVPLDPKQLVGSAVPYAASKLEARVEELRLERTGSTDMSFRLRIKTRIRLVRTADGAVLYDQPAEYRSGPCLFADWTLHNAFQSVAETGYQQLAEQCVSRLLATTDQPMLLGAGYRKTPAPNRNLPVRLASNRDPSGRLPAQLVDYSIAGSLGIYSTGNEAHVVFQRPLTRDQANTEALSDMDYMLDELNQQPNMLVALPACAVAVPISLCKQSVALVRGLSPRTVEEADAQLTAAANETRPHQELAVLVAQQLAPRTSEPVMLVRQPLPPGAAQDTQLMHYFARGTLVSLTGGQTANGYLLSQGADTALEIRVQEAALTGNGGINPKLALWVEARATLWRSRDGQQLYSCPAHYCSQSRKFTEWAAHDARLFRAELHKCYHELSAAMVDQLVQRGGVPPARLPQPTFAQGR